MVSGHHSHMALPWWNPVSMHTQILASYSEGGEDRRGEGRGGKERGGGTAPYSSPYDDNIGQKSVKNCIVS